MTKVLRLPNVMNLTGLSRSSIYAYMSEGRFPVAVKLGPKAVGWLEPEISDWIDARIRSTSIRQ